MTPRQRVEAALSHTQPDRVPLDMGSSTVTGMQVNSVYRLRQALGLDPPGTPVKVIEPYLMLGEVAPDLQDALGVDVTGIWAPRTYFGFPNENWKEWRLFDGTPVLVSEHFNTDPEPDGSIYQYPEGDRSAPPSGHMPKDGFYFDTIIRQDPIDEDRLDPEDNLAEFGPISGEDLAHWERAARRAFDDTDRATIANFGGTGFGDIALVPAPWLKHPKGIRDVA
ncbi:MAG: methyltransferase, partial [Anaerolineae bacterium]|nr:methyltransferase [Anaerolineae bacterium]